MDESGGYDNAQSLFIDGNNLFIANGYNSLGVFDITNNTNPSKLGSYDPSGFLTDVYVDGNRAFVTEGKCINILNISDLSDIQTTITVPSANKVGAYCTSASTTFNNVVRGKGDYTGYLYIGATSNTYIFDISTETTPDLLSTHNQGGSDLFATADGDYFFIAGGAGLRTYKTGDLANIHLNYFGLTLPGSTVDFAVNGNYAYTADQGGGINVVNISNLAGETLTKESASITVMESPDDIEKSGNELFIVDKGSALTIVDVTTPTSPSIKGKVETTGYAERVKLSGSYAYIAQGGLSVIDISDTTSPSEARTVATTGTVAKDLAINGNNVFMADGNYLSVISISNPLTASEVASLDLGNSGFDLIAYDNDRVYLAANNVGVQIVDVSNPTSPSAMGKYEVSDKQISALAASNNTVYVAFDFVDPITSKNVYFFQAIDVTDGNAPVLQARGDCGGAVTDIFVQGNYVYASAGLLYIFDKSNAQEFSLVDVYRSNASTFIRDGSYGYGVGGILTIIDSLP